MSKDKSRFFQFLAGERKGEIVIFDKIEEEDGMIFISFTDGSRVNEDFIQPIGERKYKNMLMAEIDDPSNPWTFEEKWVGRQEEKRAKDADGNSVIVQPFIEGKKKITPIPPKKVKSNFGKIDQHSESIKKEKIKSENSLEVKDESNKKIEIKINNPVWLMLEKAKKFDTDINLTLTLSLPSKSLYNVAKESFENGGDDVIEFIINNITDTKIKESLRIALKDAYDDTEKINEDKYNIPFETQITEIEKPKISEPIMTGPNPFNNDGSPLKDEKY